ncbi:hypothetical protein BU14_0433s0013 [Porphyra umbilicalis]|uniref:DOMON domain-containing protein n=1 Tax=Porphyra umbilicalis TaxID=2786 RepID=A0A1X6NV70_PORUM|nr:hypothetical protein BU14_0433s0013 [Porphyra umbilicalis]|eukprot:OSX72455.1 hypothetical protein BU14_0433s0013 [Porphyra umbilicalis]
MAFSRRSRLLRAVAAAATTLALAVRPAAAIVAADNTNCRLDFGGVTRTYGHCATLAHEPTAEIKLFWAVNGTMISVAWTSASTGWSAFALAGDQMRMVATPPVLAVIGYSTAAAPTEAAAAVYALTGKTSGAVQPISAAAAAAAGYLNVEAVRDGATKRLAVSYDRVRCVAPTVLDTTNNVLWAAGPPPPSGTALAHHGRKHMSTGMDFAVVEKELLSTQPCRAPPPPPAAPVSPAPPAPTAGAPAPAPPAAPTGAPGTPPPAPSAVPTAAPTAPSGPGATPTRRPPPPPPACVPAVAPPPTRPPTPRPCASGGASPAPRPRSPPRTSGGAGAEPVTALPLAAAPATPPRGGGDAGVCAKDHMQCGAPARDMAQVPCCSDEYYCKEANEWHWYCALKAYEM